MSALQEINRLRDIIRDRDNEIEQKDKEIASLGTIRDKMDRDVATLLVSKIETEEEMAALKAKLTAKGGEIAELKAEIENLKAAANMSCGRKPDDCQVCGGCDE